MIQEELQFEIHKLLPAALPQQVWRGSCAERPIEGSRPVIHSRPCLVSIYIMVVTHGSTQGNGGEFPSWFRGVPPSMGVLLGTTPRVLATKRPVGGGYVRIYARGFLPRRGLTALLLVVYFSPPGHLKR
jgi:hypothetical protein